MKTSWVPKSSALLTVLLIAASCITSTTMGFDSSMMNALNILPSYTDYFHLTTATLSLNTAATWMGGGIVCLFYGNIVDYIGRRPALTAAAALTVCAAIIQAAAQNVGMFVTARILLGMGMGASTVSGPTYLAETLPLRWRALGLGVFFTFFYVGGLLSAGVTYKTAQYDSTWAWRLPSALQGVFSVISLCIMPFLPESPRWLIHHDRHEEALEVVAATEADGNKTDVVVLAQYKEIVDTLRFEKEHGKTVSLKTMINTPSSRKRMMLALSVAICAILSGNNIASYYLSLMLDNAGITDTTTQLEINIILNAWCLVVAVLGTLMSDYIGRKTQALISTSLLTIFIFMVGALTKVYGTSGNTSGVYGTVAAIFLFQGSFSFAWTPLTVLYPPEVLNYPIRANGMGVYGVLTKGCGLLTTFAFPYALDAIGWKLYMINGCWDVLELAFVAFFWIETKGKTLEEIDELIDGKKHSDVPDIGVIRQGKADLGEVLVGLTPPGVDMKTASADVSTTKE
ncbi:MFS sugar transporter-like protein [Pleurostoma richardsiae]|uniref:MFS sugar transporter-like protein n=1 Tax=Pleurostoma richardsiae TaxID=41990 RepID=A0AA38VDA5_9PEZI|nr:MFS sugar transporter-like protein [Pleurostoma richardsiae]